MPAVVLRSVAVDDIEAFFTHQRDREANRMTACGAADPEDRAAFLRHWDAIMRELV